MLYDPLANKDSLDEVTKAEYTSPLMNSLDGNISSAINTVYKAHSFFIVLIRARRTIYAWVTALRGPCAENQCSLSAD